MKQRGITKLAFVFISTLLAGCDPMQDLENAEGSFSQPPPSSIETLAIRPAYSVVTETGTSLQLRIDFWFLDGSVGSETSETITWISDNETVAIVDAQGKVTTMTEGDTMIHSRVGGLEADARIIVDRNAVLKSETNDKPSVHWDCPPWFGDPSQCVPTTESKYPGNKAPEKETTPIEEPGPIETPPPTESPAPPTEETQPAEVSPPNPQEAPPATLQEMPPPSAEAPFADVVISYTKGSGGGFGENKLPDVVLGSPKGNGLFQGSFDIVSLGASGEIVLEFTDYLVFDGEGDDFIVFENAFQVGSNPDNTFAEPGIVGVSADGISFVEFSCDSQTHPYAGCAGIHPTLANPETNTIDPTNPAVAGGDAFDLSEVDLQTARFIRIRDAGIPHGPVGPGTAGFDLDAVAIVHGTLP